MQRNHSQRPGYPVQIGDHGAARLDPRQIQPFQPRKAYSRPCENGIAMPAYAGRVYSDRQRLEACPFGNDVAWQGRGAGAQPKIGLLQGDDVRAQCRYAIQHSPGIAPKIGSKARADIPCCQTQSGF